MLPGTATRAAARSHGSPPTTLVPAVAPAATAAIADLFAARGTRSRQVRAACKKRRMCVRATTCVAVARQDAAAAAAALPGPHPHVTHDSFRPVCRVVAGRSAVTAPSQSAAQGGRE